MTDAAAAVHPLDNPFWSSLATLHRGIAQGDDGVLRYPANVAPFLGLAEAGIDVAGAFARLVPEGDTALLLGVAPATVPAGWRLQPLEELAQMQCTTELAVPDGPEIVPLDEAQRGDVLELTALVYPHYFRPRTMDLGRYFGMYMPDQSGPDQSGPDQSGPDQSGPDRSGRQRLAAMIGERLGAPGFREMSAICTHPDFIGRGYARRLTAMLSNDTLARGDLPFLHVSQANTRAVALYERMGYRLRRTIPFWSLQRSQNLSQNR